MEGRRSPADGSYTIGLVERNISALLERRKAEDGQLKWQDRLAERISRFAGSMAFVWLHIAAVGGWVGVNLGAIPWITPFDRSFVMLAMMASVEGIFLSTFVLISQNRMQRQAAKRTDLNLQISLLSEHELTRLIKIVTEIGERLDVPSAKDPEIVELENDVRPEQVLETLERGNGREQGS